MDEQNNEALNQEMVMTEEPSTNSPIEENLDQLEIPQDQSDVEPKVPQEQIEQQSNVPGDVPYNRFKEMNDKYHEAQTERERLRLETEHYKALYNQRPQSPEELVIEQQKTEARALLKELGVPLQEDVDQRIQAERDRLIAERQAEDFQRSVNDQEKEIQRKYGEVQGVPKTNAQELMRWAQENEVFTSNLEHIFKIKYFNELASAFNTPKVSKAPINPQRAVSGGSQPNLDEMSSAEMEEWMRKNPSR